LANLCGGGIAKFVSAPYKICSIAAQIGSEAHCQFVPLTYKISLQKYKLFVTIAGGSGWQAAVYLKKTLLLFVFIIIFVVPPAQGLPNPAILLWYRDLTRSL